MTTSTLSALSPPQADGDARAALTKTSGNIDRRVGVYSFIAGLDRPHESEQIMSLRDFLAKQFIEVVEWNEPADGILSYRYPMQDQEIMNGGKLTVRESQMAAFINEGRIADVFGPGLYTLTTQTLPLLTDLM